MYQEVVIYEFSFNYSCLRVAKYSSHQQFSTPMNGSFSTFLVFIFLIKI